MKDLPRNWEWRKLREIAEINDRDHRTPVYLDKGIPLISPKDFDTYAVDFSKPKYVSKEEYENFARKCKPEYEDILYSRIGTIGEARLIETDQKFVALHSIAVIKPNREKLSSRYLFFLLKTDLIKRQARLGTKSIGTPDLGLNEIRNFKIPLPPLPVQNQIVAILDRAERLKQMRQKANEETGSVVQSIFYEMFGDPIKNEKGYPVKPLQEVCQKITDGTHITPTYVEKGIPFLRVTDLTCSNDSKKFIPENEHKELIKRCKPEIGDILYTKNGTIGIAKMVDWTYEFSIFVSLCLLKPKTEIIRPQYLEAFLNTPFALEQAMLHSKKGTITNLHLIEIKQIKILLPPLKEQDKFIADLEVVNSLKRKQESSTHALGSLFNCLMQKAFSGELVS